MPTATQLTFNEWTPQSVTFFTPDLTNFIRVWERAGIPTMLRKYDSDTSSTGVIYSGRIATPASGFIIEIIAYDVDLRFQSSFSAYAEDECGGAMEIHAGNLTYWWKKNVYFETGSALPQLLVAQITQPVPAGDDLLELGAYLEDATGANLKKSEAAIRYPAPNNCSSADVWLEVYSANGYVIPVRTIANGHTASYGASLSVASFQNEMNAMLDALMGCNKGYSRFVDWHIGIFMDGDGTSIDANGEWLCQHRVGFHNGGTINIKSSSSIWGWGSNWARGAAGMGIEFWGAYDGSIFNNVTQLDYCSPSGFSIPSASGSNERVCQTSVLNGVLQAEENSTVTETPDNWDDDGAVISFSNATIDDDVAASCSTLRKGECQKSSSCHWKKESLTCYTGRSDDDDATSSAANTTRDDDGATSPCSALGQGECQTSPVCDWTEASLTCDPSDDAGGAGDDSATASADDARAGDDGPVCASLGENDCHKSSACIWKDKSLTCLVSVSR
jgi:hypothetical protein